MAKRELDILAIKTWQQGRAADAPPDTPLPLTSLWDPFALLVTAPCVHEKVVEQRALPGVADEGEESGRDE